MYWNTFNNNIRIKSHLSVLSHPPPNIYIFFLNQLKSLTLPKLIDAIKYITVKMGLYDFGCSYLISKSSNILKYNYNLK